MQDAEVIHVTDPIEFAVDEEGSIECTIVSRGRRFIFSISRHKCRNANMAMRRLLDEADRMQCDRVRDFKQVEGGKGRH